MESLDRISPEDDLRWYAINYGTGNSYGWPEYEVRYLQKILPLKFQW